jgi:Ca2+-binding RTX toxin-like protein
MNNTDTVKSSVDYTLSANVENLTFTAAGPLTGTGNALNNTYTVNNSGDVIIEALNAGNDSVNSSVSYTLGANVENLSLTGASAINGVGNELNNVLRGDFNSAANVLTGGLGNDTYYVGAGDTVVENSGAGSDTVVSTMNYTLGTNVENLTLTGNVGLFGIGNAGDNVIIGSMGNDYLEGGAGNDRLAGGIGADMLYGGSGNDVFVFNNSNFAYINRDTIADFTTGSDSIELSLAMFSGIGVTGALSATAFASGAGVTAATTATQHIMYDTTSGTLYYDADGAGGSGSTAFAQFANSTPVLTASDFAVV